MEKENAFSYDSNDNLKKIIDAIGTSYDYTYDNNKNLIKAVSSDGITYDITNDSYGNPTAVKITGTDGSTETLKSSMSYDSSGKQVLTLTNCNGETTTYNYSSDMHFLSSLTDVQGTTNYIWNNLNDRLLSVSRNGNGGTSTIQYTYDNAGTLTKIKHNGYFYEFTYDGFGNTTSVKAGNRTLVTNEYLTNNGNISKVTYGNNATVNYGYDEKGRVTTIQFGNTVVCRNIYDGEGRIYRQITPEDPEGIQYRYDTLGRLIEISGTVEVRIGYDDKNRMNALTSIADGKTTKTEYTYGAMSQITSIKINNVTVVNYQYDRLGRKISTRYPDAGNYTITSSYKTRSDGSASNNPNVLTLGNDTYTYQYDSNNILYGINRNSEGLYHGFYFDGLGQLIRESLKDKNETILYEYDTGGNITSKKHYSYTTGVPSSSTLLYTDTYTYGDSSWKDLLTAYNGQTITYDNIGNALTWRDNMVFTWVNGRRLASLTKSGTNVSYTYDVDGIRTSKTVNGVTTTYYLNGSQILSQKTGSTRMDFLYDENGNPFGLDYNGVRYYYITNGEGDIVKIINQSGQEVVKYTYDGWGVPTVSGSLASTLGNDNPFRFKGYYYDNESGMYYLGTRYYDPEIGRFISADDVAILGVQDNLYDKNIFAYCDNNPIFRIDTEGEFWNVVAGAVIGGAISGGIELILQIHDAAYYKKDLNLKSIFTSVGVATASGALGGALAATGAGLVGQIVGNAAISGATEAVSQFVGGNRDVGNIISNSVAMATVGAISGAIGGAGIRAKGTALKSAKNELKKLTKRGVERAISNPVAYKQLIENTITNHAIVMSKAIKSTTSSFLRASIFSNSLGHLKNNWLEYRY